MAVDAADVMLPLGMLFMLVVFAVVYLNYLPEKTSFMVKLVGVTLAASLAALGSVGWIITPAYSAAYRNNHFMANRHSLRFTPNSRGGYDVVAIPFDFDRDFGVELDTENMWVDLGFDFPFYRQVWDKAYLVRDGAVSFGQALDWQDTLYRYGPLPAIFPLVADFVNPDTLPAELSGGLFAKSTADKLTVTWYRLPEFYAHEARYTFQLTLYPSGIFEIAYDNLPATQNYNMYVAWNTAWLIGVTPGSPETDARHIRFTADLPFTGDSRGGIMEDYYLDFRRYLHQIFAPLAYFILGSSLFILTGFPLFFHANLVEPLNTLLKGVKQFNAGNLEIMLPVAYRDEIGFLTQSFNELATEQRALVSDLEMRVTERTVELEAYAAQNVRLFEEEQRQREIVESLRQAMLATNRSMDYNAVLAEILAQLREIIHFDGVGIFLPKDDYLHLAHGVGLNPAFSNTRFSLAGNQRIVQVFKHRQTEIIVDNETQIDRQSSFQGEVSGSLIATPLLFGQKTIGVLTLYRTDKMSFTAEEISLLQAFATQSAIAIKNAELYRQARNAATQEERTRLARDLHDAVNQTLFSVALMAESLPAIWQENPQQGAAVLEELRVLTQSAQSEMRTLLMELRPASLTQKSFGELLRYLTRSFTARTRIPVELTIDGNGILPPDVQIAFYRTAQEAFNNIAKHAQATQTEVHFDCTFRQAILNIIDNGAGFDTTAIPAGHLGLDIMAERAVNAGLTLEVESVPECGTTITLIWEQVA